MFLGDYRIEIIPDAEFRLDGGAMFGIVPRVVWERVSPPDELNRVRLQTNCLLVETASERILIETGLGEKWPEKEARKYGIARTRSFAETLFERAGLRPSDITIVVNTHLHFDHAGGNTINDFGFPIADFESEDRKPKTEDRKPIPQFPNARYFVSKSEYERALQPSERDRASYLKENWEPVVETGQLELKPDRYEVVEGLTLETVRGHSDTMQTACLARGNETLYCFADLVPTRAHLALPWIMGYDLYPLETLAFKKKILPRAVREDWICLFYHDAEAPLGRLIEEDGKMRAVPVS